MWDSSINIEKIPEIFIYQLFKLPYSLFITTELTCMFEIQTILYYGIVSFKKKTFYIIQAQIY